MNEKVLEAFRLHVESEYPKEACGFIIGIGKKERYFPATNIAEKPEEFFIIDPISYADAEDAGDILAICHSHLMRIVYLPKGIKFLVKLLVSLGIF